jgi:hypothetical protein
MLGVTPARRRAPCGRLREDHDRLQADLLSLSSNSKQIIAKQSGHWIQLDEPALVTDAVKQVVGAVRQKSRFALNHRSQPNNGTAADAQ